jgi:hypothetical protein
MLAPMRALVLILVASAACVLPQQQQQQPAYQTYPSPEYAQPAPAGPAPASTLPPAPVRRITFNAVVASARDLQTLDTLEQRWGGRLPSGDYWYDNDSGAAGRWGGPTIGVLPPGLQLGGPMPANASGGGDGSVTGVFINGRELHPLDVQQLESLVGTVYQGRWFVDANGNFGMEGGLVLGNLYQLAQQHGGGQGGDNHYYKKDDNGSVFIGGGCVSVDTKDSTYYGSGC